MLAGWLHDLSSLQRYLLGQDSPFPFCAASLWDTGTSRMQTLISDRGFHKGLRCVPVAAGTSAWRKLAPPYLLALIPEYCSRPDEQVVLLFQVMWGVCIALHGCWSLLGYIPQVCTQGKQSAGLPAMKTFWLADRSSVISQIHDGIRKSRHNASVSACRRNV